MFSHSSVPSARLYVSVAFLVLNRILLQCVFGTLSARLVVFVENRISPKLTHGPIISSSGRKHFWDCGSASSRMSGNARHQRRSRERELAPWPCQSGAGNLTTFFWISCRQPRQESQVLGINVKKLPETTSVSAPSSSHPVVRWTLPVLTLWSTRSLWICKSNDGW